MDSEPAQRSDGANRLWPHVAALVLALAVTWPLLRFDGVFTVDEGSYALQARTLEQGTWDMGYAFIDADPAGRFVPYHGSGVVNGEVVPYPKHPLVPLAMRWMAHVLGEQVGFRLLGVVSVVGLALTAWALAGDLGSRRGRPWAFWIAAASPVLANAWLLWPHAPSAFAGGLLVLGGVRSRSSWRWVALAAAGAAVGVLLRSEAVLWAGAASAALVIVAPSARQRLCGVLIGAGGAAAYLVERAWRSDIVGTAVGGITSEERAPGSTVLDRLRGMKVILVEGAVASETALVLAAIVLALVAVVVVQLLRGASLDEGPGLLLLASAVVLALRFVVAPDDPALGLLVAAPVLALAVGSRCVTRPTAWLVVALGLFVFALMATTYVDGGAFQWGGRFASPMLAPLAALAGAAVAERLGAGSRRSWSRAQRLLAAGVVSLLAVQGIAAVIVPDEMRDAARQRLASVTSLGQSVNIAGGQMIPRLDWRSWPDRCWISIPADGDARDAAEVLAVLAASGVAKAAYAGVDPEILEAAGAELTPDADNELVGIVHVPGAGSRRRISPPYRCPAS